MPSGEGVRAPGVTIRRLSGLDRRDGGLYAQVTNALGQDIVNGRLPAGSVIYADQLCERFDVSRSVIRESVRTLSSMGLVESRPQVGTRVLPRTSWDLLNPRIVFWRGRGTDYLVQQRELLELRLGVESVAAELAASRISDEQAAELLTHARRMADAQAAADPAAFYEADAEFHRVLVEGSGNAVISKFADTIAAVLAARSVDHRPEMAKMLREAVELHIRLAEAVMARDRDGARRAAYDVVVSTLEEFGVFDSAAAERTRA